MWGVSDQQAEGGGYVVYSGFFDMSSSEPDINWKTMDSSWDRVCMYNEAYGVGLKQDGQVFMFRS